MNAVNVKEEAKVLIEKLPENATWDDLMREIYFRLAIEHGLDDIKVGKLSDVAEIRARFGLK